ncbi:hypothetical protein FHW79_001674 [Azospirillum sp. OGB3]|uniref:phage tail length tape measure family protein n=1 Tax=Azospirillum sp. OGB3 TaxID=2587012 RepID=UPI001605D6FD|nr:phage tail length tape measure family protein [Azospirillum sp. OGB3]MBB3264059.1 hypothetical protein [Azospirillum sp. OGB3]
MAQNVESLAVGFDDQISAGAKAAEQALQNLGTAAVATEERVTRTAKSGEALAKQYDRTAREAAAVARATAGLRRDLEDLERSEASLEAKEKQRAIILGQIEVATQRAKASVERYFAAAEAGAAASTAAANAQSAGMAAATASTNSWAGAMARVYETATSVSTGVNGTARALQALNADFQAGRASFAEWTAGARGLETALRGISAAQKAINDNTGVSRSPVNTATIGELRYATTGKGAGSGNTLALVTGDAEASARRLKDIEAAFGAMDATLEGYREELGLVDAAQKRYEAGLAELEAIVRRAGLAEEEGAALLRAYAAAHDPAIAAAKLLADEEKAALARMSADWDAAVREREADAAMIIADEQATARAAAQTAAENARLAASYRAVMAAVDPTAAAQQRFDQALTDLRAGAVAAGRSVEDLAADEERLTAVLSPAAVAVQKEETALRSLVGSLDRTFGAEERLTAQQRLLYRAMTEGIGGIRLTREQHEALSRTLREQHEIATRTATSTKLAAHESVNLGFQVQDFVVQVGSGQGLLIPLLQQAPQAVGAVGGVTRAMALLGTAVGAVLSPVGLAATALVGLAVASVAVGVRAFEVSSQTREFGVAIRAMGRDAELTTGQLRAMVFQMQAAGAGGDESRQAVSSLVRNPKLASGAIPIITALTPDVAAGTNQGVAETAKALGDAFAGGYEAIKRFDEATGALTAKQLESIHAFAEQGDQAQALATFVDALTGRYKGLAEQALSPGERAVKAIGTAWRSFADSVIDSGPVVAVISAIADKLQTIADYFKGPTAQQMAARGRDSIRAALDQAQADYARFQQETASYKDKDNPDTIISGFAGSGSVNQRAEQYRQTIAALTAEYQKADQAAQAATATATAGATQAAGATGKSVEAQQKYVDAVAATVKVEGAALSVNAASRAATVARAQAEVEATANGIEGGERERLIRLRVAEATRGQTTAAMDQLAALSQSAQGNLALADAYGISEAAAIRQKAANDAVAAAATNAAVNVAELTRQNVAAAGAAAGADLSKQAADLMRTADLQQRVAAAAGLSGAARQEAQRQADVYRNTAPAIAAAQAAEAQGDFELAQRLRDLASAYDIASQAKERADAVTPVNEFPAEFLESAEAMDIVEEVLG